METQESPAQVNSISTTIDSLASTSKKVMEFSETKKHETGPVVGIQFDATGYQVGKDLNPFRTNSKSNYNQNPIKLNNHLGEVQKVAWLVDIDECVYHSPCLDGSAAAFAIQKFAKVKKFTPVLAGKDVMYQEGMEPKMKHILYVDVAPSLHRVLTLLRNGNNVLILDHHEGNLIEFKKMFQRFEDSRLTYAELGFNGEIKFIYSSNLSGCGIVWNCYSTNDQIMPWLLEVIQDRDTWKNAMLATKYVIPCIFDQYPNTTPEDIKNILEFHPTYIANEWLGQGEFLNEQRNRHAKTYAKKAILCKMSTTVFRVLCVTCPENLISDVGNLMANDPGADFAAVWTYYLDRDVWKISLRASVSCDINMFEVAKLFDPRGGGHAKAAGFEIDGSKMEGLCHLKHIFMPIQSNEIQPITQPIHQ